MYQKTIRRLFFPVVCCIFAGNVKAAVEEKKLFPPNAKPGECYARVFVPPRYETTEKKVLKKDASSEVLVEEAQFRTVRKKILVKEASEEIIPIPPEYKIIEEKVEVKPATVKFIEQPAQFRTVKEKVIDTPAHTVWKKGRGPIERMNNSTGEIMCLVEVPATYKTVTKRIVEKPARIEKVTVPAQYKVVRKKVVETPANFTKVKIPAEYKTVEVYEMVKPAQKKKKDLPAEYETVKLQSVVTEGQMEWRSILCDTNMNPELILSLQKSLKRAGYDPGKVDGKVGSKTVEALKKYQNARGLAVGSLTMETLKTMGLV